MNANTSSRRQVAVGAILAALALSFALAAGGARAATPAPPPVTGVVNLNTASAEELQLLPGVGEVRAVAIVARRNEQGGFKKVDDLLEVKGIGQAMLERMRPYVTLTGETTARKL